MQGKSIAVFQGKAQLTCAAVYDLRAESFSNIILEQSPNKILASIRI
jgi:hypothetical protein